VGRDEELTPGEAALTAAMTATEALSQPARLIAAPYGDEVEGPEQGQGQN